MRVHTLTYICVCVRVREYLCVYMYVSSSQTPASYKSATFFFFFFCNDRVLCITAALYPFPLNLKVEIRNALSQIYLCVVAFVYCNRLADKQRTLAVWYGNV